MHEGILAFLVFFPFVAGLIAYFCGKRCSMVAVISVVVEFVGILYLENMLSEPRCMFWRYPYRFSVPEVCGLGLNFCVYGFQQICAFVAALMWMMATVFSREYFKHHKNVNRF